MSWTRKFSVYGIVAAAVGVAGQMSDVVTCIGSYDWSINSRNQTPCLVAAYLESACGKPTTISQLPLNMHYLGPTGAQQNECLCSSVTYSLVSACGGCQARTFQNWTTWSMNCINPTLTTFPEQLPAAVEVPSWAFLNVSLSNNTFDPIAAENSLGPAGPSSASSSSLTTPTTSSTSPAAAPTSDVPIIATEAKKHSHAGAIAGGVVGGLVFLAIVALGVLWWYMRKKRNAIQQDLTFDSRALVSGTIVSQNTGSPDGPSPAPYSSPLYGTSTDMSTYPGSPVTSAVYTTVPGSRRSMESISQSLAHFGGMHAPSIRQPPGYRGAAEV